MTSQGWGWGSSGREPAWQVQGPEFKPKTLERQKHRHTLIKLKKEKKKRVSQRLGPQSFDIFIK
jgi:hypothetical protein